VKKSAQHIFRPGNLQKVAVLLLVSLTSGCIVQFLPKTTEDKNLLVVEGLITDQPGPKVVKVSTSMPLGTMSQAKPLNGCNVTITDDLGYTWSLSETAAGTYTTMNLQGEVGRSYQLHIRTNSLTNNKTYESAPMLMGPVPGIDSVYYEKDVLSRASDGFPMEEGCQVFLNTHDPQNKCRFFRWEFDETWEFSLPYQVPNKTCWITEKSDQINIKNTTSLSDDRIERLPLNFITNKSDRLKTKYSILVSQYSLNEDEYAYWEKLENTVEQVGSLYDIIPASIPSNIKCLQDPGENVLGYFSVSSVRTKRIFIKDQFRGLVNMYGDCENITVAYNDPLFNLGVTVWLIIDHPEPYPGYKVLTYFKGCADCSVRGSTVKPDFW